VFGFALIEQGEPLAGIGELAQRGIEAIHCC
jgi:hypothetical protein